jgi:exonuclease III
MSDEEEPIAGQPPQPHLRLPMYRPPNVYILNIRSMNKSSSLQFLKNEMELYNAEVVLVTETFLKRTVNPVTSCQMEGFSMFRLDRPVRKGGRGVAIYARQSLNASSFNVRRTDAQLEYLCIQYGIGANKTYVRGGGLPPPRFKSYL